MSALGKASHNVQLKTPSKGNGPLRINRAYPVGCQNRDRQAAKRRDAEGRGESQRNYFTVVGEGMARLDRLDGGNVSAHASLPGPPRSSAFLCVSALNSLPDGSAAWQATGEARNQQRVQARRQRRAL